MDSEDLSYLREEEDKREMRQAIGQVLIAVGFGLIVFSAFGLYLTYRSHVEEQERIEYAAKIAQDEARRVRETLKHGTPEEMDALLRDIRQRREELGKLLDEAKQR